jgi:flagellin
MGFRINTNIAAMKAHTTGVANNRELTSSLEKLSSGLRINKAADDASGMAIADSLRSQANSLGQAVGNANDAIGVIQIADKAMDEQLKILDTIKTKAIQAASDTQNGTSREAIQKDVNRLIEELNNIAKTTSFNGQSLLSGEFTNKEFQIGAYSNQTIKASIQNTESLAIGDVKTVESQTQSGNTSKLDNDYDIGDTKIDVATTVIDGLAKGDVIRFNGHEDTYVIENIKSSTGDVWLTSGLKSDLDQGTRFEIVNAKEENEYVMLDADLGNGDDAITLAPSGNFSDGTTMHEKLRGLAVGDVVNVKGSTAEWDLKVNYIDTDGAVSFGGATITATVVDSLGEITIKNTARLSEDAETLFAAASGQNLIEFSAAGADRLAGLGAGDRIKFEGHDTEYVVGAVAADAAGANNGAIALTTDLLDAVSAGTAFEVVEYAGSAESLHATAVAVDEITMNGKQIAESGVAKGDHLRVTNSVGHISIMEVTTVDTSNGAISMASLTGGTLTDGGISAALGDMNAMRIEVIKSDGLGDSLTSSDYVQYEVEGMKLDGVQMTDENGYGVAEGGLGRVADMINEQTDKTGVKAVATVEATSAHAIKGAQLYEDVVINGELILEAGTTIEDADTSNRLLNAINDKSSETGITAAVNDGVLELSSDGRAMSLEGLSEVAGLTDGVYSGKLDMTLVTGETMEVSAKHFQDAALTQAYSESVSVNGTAQSHNLSDVVYGQNSDGEAGLMMTQDSAMLAMDIVEKAITELDGTRADLGSVQNELTVTINNISVTQVNVKAAESQIRDVDFAQESATFQKHNILAQSGSYAMSQANAVQQNVMRLLQ